MRPWIKNIDLLAIGIFLMVPVLTGNFAMVWALEASVVIEQDTPVSEDLRIESGMVMGQFREWPVSKVLDSLLGPMSIEYHASEELLDYPVSATFDQVPLNDALHTVLDPFNYLVFQDAQENINRLNILSLKGGWPESLPGPQESTTARVSPGPGNRDLHAFEENLREALINTLPKEKVPASEIDNPEPDHQPQPTDSGLLPLDEVELTEEQRQAFDVAGQKIELSEENRERLLPTQQSTEQGQPQDPTHQQNRPSLESADWFSSPQKPLLDGILESLREANQ